ncbi:MAG: archease [Desulfomonile tiedjei]|uniref:Archease n=1 Tax=Desulfomonile tiedjei TaxID=2358 RepID=A0A9D6V641_9BACT|nr:archease [Desulfomonile tiedjei]
MKSPESGWTLLDHTADIRMEVRGHTLAELFENAALGLMDILLPGTSVAPQTESAISLREDTTEELLVGWLREIVFQYQTAGLVLARVEILEVTEKQLTGKLVYGPPPENCQPEVEIKGVTYHGLTVQAQDWGYSAKVVFDI